MSSCTVDVSLIDYISCEYLETFEEERTNNDEMKCQECGKHLRKGEKYIVEWKECTMRSCEGYDHCEERNEQEKNFRYITCQGCKSVRDVFFDCWYYEMIWDDMSECLADEFPEEKFSQLTPEGKAKFLEMWQPVNDEIAEEEEEEEEEEE